MIYDVEFRGVSKRYRIRSDSESVTPGFIGKVGRLWKGAGEFWALRDLSFSVRSGEAVGIIGHNGAGKSTALKLLSNITTPTSGEIHIQGRIAALLEVGSGFHPELTGRENVYLSGAILGMRRVEISEKLESILDFAGVRNFADVPVKRYSSGMYVRLGFAIAAHLDSDILLLDEVLAVGDAKFQERCRHRILELKASGKTILFISHDLAAVRQLCDRALLLDHGRLAAEGVPSDVIGIYSRLGSERHFETQPQLTAVSRGVHVTSLTFFDSSGTPTTELRSGYPLRAVVEYATTQLIPNAVINLLFFSLEGWTLFTHFSTEGRSLDLLPGIGAVEFTCEELTLGPGTYAASCTIDDEHHEIDVLTNTFFAVSVGKPVRGRFHSPHQWRQLDCGEQAIAARSSRQQPGRFE